jgi:ferredoxin
VAASIAAKFGSRVFVNRWPSRYSARAQVQIPACKLCSGSGMVRPACIIQCMSLKILDTCVNCDVCEPACPNKAISLGEEFYVIDPDLCTECVGHHDEPQCVVVCPVECIITDPQNVESHTQLDLKYQHLMVKESAA